MSDTPRQFVSVHDAHCCKIHGCKYGEDECLVFYGDELGVECEYCEMDKNNSGQQRIEGGEMSDNPDTQPMPLLATLRATIRMLTIRNNGDDEYTAAILQQAADALSATKLLYYNEIDNHHATQEQLAAERKERLIAELKNQGTLANNLCSDHRDKQVGQPCLACTIEHERKAWKEAKAQALHNHNECQRWFHKSKAAEQRLAGMVEQCANELHRIAVRNKILADNETGLVGFSVSASFAAAYFEAEKVIRSLAPEAKGEPVAWKVIAPAGFTRGIYEWPSEDTLETWKMEGNTVIPLYASLQPSAGEDREDAALKELGNIANAQRFDRERFDDDSAFADWAQSRARFILDSAREKQERAR